MTGTAAAYYAASIDQYPYTLLYGGLQETVTPSGAVSWHVSNETWSFVQGRWMNLTRFFNGQSTPGPRWDAMMTYDAADQYVLLYGGCALPPINGLCTRTLGDTWSYVSGRWNIVAPAPPPPPPPGPGPPPPPPIVVPPSRWDGALTWDGALGSGGGVVLFGGATGLLDRFPLPNVPPTIQILSDTWKWDSGKWTNITMSFGPSARYGARMATDSLLGTTILFGGSNYARYDSPPIAPVYCAACNVSGGAFDDTWEISSTGSWTQLSFGSGGPGPAPPGPSARWDFGMAAQDTAFQSSGAAIILMGGTNDSGVVFVDEWLFRGTLQGWFQLQNPTGTTSGFVPAPRWGAALVYDGFDKEYLLFGGTSLSGAPLGDAWFRILGAPWAQALPMASHSAGPGPRYEAAAAFDELAKAAVVFGGESCGTTLCTFLGDTWMYSGGQWHSVRPPLSPSSRFGAAIAYDPLTKVVVLFGGCGTVCPLGDTWVFNAQAYRPGTWTQLFSPIAPPARYFATLTWDPQLNGLVLFGGCEGSVGPCPAGDTWIYSGTGSWRHDTSAAGPTAPPARFGAAATYIPGEGVILFGGMGANGPLQDTWNYSQHQSTIAASGPAATVMGWHVADSINIPPPRVFGTLAYDGPDHWLVLFGGCEPSHCPSQDPWMFNLTHPKPPPGRPNPPANPWWNLPQRMPQVLPMIWNVTLPPGYGLTGVWDPVDGSAGYILVIGGRGVTGVTVGGTTSFVGNDWNDLGPFV